MARRRADDASERRTAHIGIHLTPTERQELADRAAQSGRQVGELVREAVFLRRLSRTDGVNPATLRELMNELTRIGNNLNQISRIANQTGAIRSEASLQATTEQLTRTMARVLTL